jgi:signal transduction histidine kinase
VVSKERFPSSGGALEAYIHASGIDSLTLLPLRLREQLLGFLGLGMDDDSPALSSEESALLGLFSSDVAQLIENNRLFEQARALIAGEERNRLARELHDSVTQTLFTASLLAESAPRLWQRDRAIASQNMEKLSVLIRGALAEMRAMLIELRTGELHDQTLDQLLQTLVEGARARTRAALHASLEPVDLPPEISLGLYRMAREALNNALVHSGAAQIELSLQAQAGGVRLRIQDDGCGFDPQRVPAGHLGLHILGERAAETGAGLQIDSSAESGTTILITWPQPDLANKPAIGAESDAER